MFPDAYHELSCSRVHGSDWEHPEAVQWWDGGELPPVGQGQGAKIWMQNDQGSDECKKVEEMCKVHCQTQQPQQKIQT